MPSMKNANGIRKRQMVRLAGIARSVEYRTDKGKPFDTIAPGLAVDNGKFSTSSAAAADDEAAYDFTSLAGAGLIRWYMVNNHANGQAVSTASRLDMHVTPEGLQSVAEFERPWLAKAIEKEPITFIQVVIGLVQIVWTVALVVWTVWAGRR